MGIKERHQRGVRKGLSAHGSHSNAVLPGHAQRDALSCSQAWLQHPEQALTDSWICHSFVGLRMLCTAGEMMKACSQCHDMEHQLQAPPTQAAFATMDENTLNNLFPRSFYKGIYNFFVTCLLKTKHTSSQKPKCINTASFLMSL